LIETGEVVCAPLDVEERIMMKLTSGFKNFVFQTLIK
jgi:hypothetical protein